MEIVNIAELHIFSRRHPGSRKPLSYWVDLTIVAQWANFMELKNTFGSADYVQDLVIFNIAGNNYRLITSVDFQAQRIYILEMMTHAQYNRW